MNDEQFIQWLIEKLEQPEVIEEYQPTVRELTLSQMIGIPVKIKK